MGLPYHVSFSGHTDVGKKRSHNEDCFFYDPEGAYAIVADGMGGHQAGEVASKIIVDTFQDEKSSVADLAPGKQILTLLQRSNQKIYQESQNSSKKQGMGSTITSILFSPDGFHVANVGDSRTYLLRHDELRQITDDHSFVQLQVQMGLITKEESRQSRLRHILTKSIGGHPTVEADLYEDSVASGDLFLLCTDGFHQGFTDEEIEDLLRKNHKDLDTFAHILVNAANDHDGSDNITVVLARVE